MQHFFVDASQVEGRNDSNRRHGCKSYEERASDADWRGSDGQ